MLTSTLQAGLHELNLAPSLVIQKRIIDYIMLLHKWNQTYSLTATNDPKLILIRHILDSLAVVPFINGPNILDFGTGAGLPGIPLALALPNYNFTLLDSSHKKTTFLNHVKLSLELANINIITKRIEDFHFALGFNTIITRATTTLDAIMKYTQRLCSEDGQILIMKGKLPTKELEIINQPAGIYNIKVPYLNEQRHLVKIIPNNNR